MTDQHSGFQESVQIIHAKGPLMSDVHDSGDGAAADSGPDLLALLGSRLCHDLVNPIGAVSNGLELLELTQDGGAAEMALIRESLDAAMARIRFFRLAFGSGAADAPIPPREILDTLAKMYAQTRTKILWRDDSSRARSEVRLAYLALSCVETAMPWGGTVEVVRNEQAWVVHVDAKRLRIDDPLWHCLGRAPLPANLRSAEVQFGVLRQVTRALRRPVSVSADETHLSLIV